MTSAASSKRMKRVESSDAELLALVRDGNLSALGALYDRHGEATRRVLSRLGVGPADIDDILQDTFIEVARCAKNFDGRTDAKPWLIGLALNKARHHRRSLQVLLKHLTAWAREPGPTQANPEESAEGADAAARARRALEQLSDRKREAFVLVVMEGLPGEQVASLLGIPVATVWTRLHHARRELRAALESEKP